MTLHVKDTTWKTVTPYVKDSNTWKAFTNAYIKDAGSWKEFFAVGGGGSSYSIQASNASYGSNISTVSISLDSTGGVSWSWSAIDQGSTPGGFGNGCSFGTVQDGFGTVLFTSYCLTASPGTRVVRSYTISVTLGSGSASPISLQLEHQF